MRWQTRITRLLGCAYPILREAVAEVGVWPLAAAVAGISRIQTVKESLGGMIAKGENLAREKNFFTD